MRKTTSLVSMTCVFLLVAALAVPALATPPSTDIGDGPRIRFVSEVVGWFLGFLPTPPQQIGPQSLPAAGKGSGASGGTTAGDGVTAACELCQGGEARVSIDPNG